MQRWAWNFYLDKGELSRTKHTHENYWIRTFFVSSLFSVFKQHFFIFSITPARVLFGAPITFFSSVTRVISHRHMNNIRKNPSTDNFFVSPSLCCSNPTHMRLIALISFNFVLWSRNPSALCTVRTVRRSTWLKIYANNPWAPHSDWVGLNVRWTLVPESLDFGSEIRKFIKVWVQILNRS